MSTVLILSDRPLLSKKEESTLAKEGVHITNSSKGSLFDKHSLGSGKLDYNVIVIGDSLRGVNPYDTYRKLRDASKSTIILLGNKLSTEMWDKCKEIGFDQYYKKPLSSSKLAKQIVKAIRKPQTVKNPPPSEVAPAASSVIKANKNKTVVKETLPTAQPVKRETEPIVSQATPEVAQKQEIPSSIWHDPKVVNLVNGILKGKIKQLHPEINLSLNEGYSYHEAESLMGTSSKETVQILEMLAKQGLLIKSDLEKILATTEGEVQLIPMEMCPNCDSPDLARGPLIEHFACGYVGLEEEFTHGFSHICPKCNHELKLIGTDYRKPGMRYVCNRCHGIFPSPMIKMRSIKTSKIYPLEDLHVVDIYSYSLNEIYRQQLEFELEPKKQFIDYLVRLGYQVKESTQVKGRSGAAHKIDILATMDDLITSHTVAIGILAAADGETEVPIDPLFNFDSHIYDTGIDGKMVIAIPRFSPEAMKFAQRQGIRVYNLAELRDLLSWKIQINQMIDINEKGQPAKFGGQPGNGDRSNPRAWLKWLLENRGYNVEEKLKVTGRSGAEHILDLFAQKDDGIINHRLAACVITAGDVFESDVNEVMQFDSAAYDAGIRDKVLICTPTLSKEAKQFAQYQRIKIIEAKELTAISTKPKATSLLNNINP
jgi:DNA-binding response OmpR family regulator